MELREFQRKAVDQLHDRAQKTKQQVVVGGEAAVTVLKAPTGAGKTYMITKFMEEQMDSDMGRTYLFVSYYPSVNDQSGRMMAEHVPSLAGKIETIDNVFDEETFGQGKIYILNAQKLGSNAGLSKSGEGRRFTLMQTIANTMKVRADRFTLVIDEAHFGAGGNETILSELLCAVQQVVAVSATPERFERLCYKVGRPLNPPVEVSHADVKKSGLLKQQMLLVSALVGNERGGAIDNSMLVDAIDRMNTITPLWRERGITPIMIIQVEDGTDKLLSRTNLDEVVSTLHDGLDRLDDETEWIRHCFSASEKEKTGYSMAGVKVDFIAPVDIDYNDEVRVVLFKRALEAGWNCKRAEVLVSFRSMQDRTPIAQLVGRVVRAPESRIIGDEILDEVYCALPYFDEKAAKAIAEAINHDIPITTKVVPQAVKSAYALRTDTSAIRCVNAYERLVRVKKSNGREWSPVKKVIEYAGLLNTFGVDANAREQAADALASVIEKYAANLDDVDRRSLVAEVAYVPTVRTVSVMDTGETVQVDDWVLRSDADTFVDLHKKSEKLLSESVANGLVTAFAPDTTDVWLTRPDGSLDVVSRIRYARFLLASILNDRTVLDTLDSVAEEVFDEWDRLHTKKLQSNHKKSRNTLNKIRHHKADVTEEVVGRLPDTVEASGVPSRELHLYVNADGKFPHSSGHSSQSVWEDKVVTKETAVAGTLGWLRNEPRKEHSFGIPIRKGVGIATIYPDFLFFRDVGDDVAIDIVDPHSSFGPDDSLLSRARGYAEYLEAYDKRRVSDGVDEPFLRSIQMVVFVNKSGKARDYRLDLGKKTVRKTVLGMADGTSDQQLLETLFQEYK